MGRLAFLSLFASALALAVVAQADPPASPPASGAPPTQAGTTNANAATAGKDPVICEWEEETGSLLGRHQVCQTKSRWQGEAFDSQDYINDTTRRSYQAGTMGH